MRLISVMLAALLLLVGCKTVEPAAEGELLPDLGHQLDRLADTGRQLVVAVSAYHATEGHWPRSPQAVRESRWAWLTHEWDAFENFQFETLSNGSLAITFDRWTSTDGSMTAQNGSIVLSDPLEPQGDCRSLSE